MALDAARGSDAALTELPVRARDRTVPGTLSGTAVNVAEVYAQFIFRGSDFQSDVGFGAAVERHRLLHRIECATDGVRVAP